MNSSSISSSSFGKLYEQGSTFQLLSAINFAAEKHANQRRKNEAATPYINHPIAVCFTLSECGVTDVNILIAAVLHDTVEDTDTTLPEIAMKFGPIVASLVSSVSDDKSLPKAERKRLQVVHVKTASKDTKLIKMADKLDNLTDLTKTQPKGWTSKRVQGYFVWSREVIDACRGTNNELEQRLDDIFNSQFDMDGNTYDCVPKDVDLSLFLEDYYKEMEEAKD